MTQVHGAKGAGAAPLPDPIRFILDEHDRQLAICDGLDTLISVMSLEPVADRVGALLHFLTTDLPLHIEDEELDLFPMLRSRCGAQGETGEILDQLATEHEEDRELANLIAADLKALHEGRAPNHPTLFHSNARAFCELQRRHLLWENRLVLPLAERRRQVRIGPEHDRPARIPALNPAQSPG